MSVEGSGSFSGRCSQANTAFRFSTTKPGVFEEEQQREVVDEADQQPDSAAAEERAQRHEQHDQAEAAPSSGRSVCGPTTASPSDAQRGQSRTEERDFQHPIIKAQPRQARRAHPPFALARAVIHQRDQEEIEQGGIDHQEQVVRIPPAVKEVGSHRQPGIHSRVFRRAKNTGRTTSRKIRNGQV